MFRRIFSFAWTFAAFGFLTGCTGLHPAPISEKFDATPGHYPAAPLAAFRPRVGVPLPAVELIAGADPSDRILALAGDELLWLATQTGRFNPVGRERLAEMISQQDPGELLYSIDLLHPAPIQGIDFLLLCSVRQLSITTDPHSIIAHAGSLFTNSKPNPTLVVTCAINLRLVDPSTGSAIAAAQDIFSRTAPAQSLGVSGDLSAVPLHLTDKQLQPILRIVLDDAMRKLLPSTDLALAHFERAKIAASPTTAPVIGGVVIPPATQPLRTVQCPECGFDCSPYDEFCPNCGSPLHPGAGRTTGSQPAPTTMK